MKIFLDNSTLLKFYHRERDTPELQNQFSAARVTRIYLSELSKIEFDSAMWKKPRMGDASELDVLTALSLFKRDSRKYDFVPTNELIFAQARTLLAKYGIEGLRTLDSLQLATALALADRAEAFITADQLLKSFFRAEGLPTELPNHTA